MLHSWALHDFPTVFSEMLLTSQNCFSFCMWRGKQFKMFILCLTFLFLKKRWKCYCWLQFVAQTIKIAHSCNDDYSLGLINESNLTFSSCINTNRYIRYFACPKRWKKPLPFSFFFGGAWKTLFLGGGQKSYYSLRECSTTEILLISIKWTETHY